jgi:hypothetical protein
MVYSVLILQACYCHFHQFLTKQLNLLVQSVESIPSLVQQLTQIVQELKEILETKAHGSPYQNHYD